MGRTLADLDPVYVVGVGLHRYQAPSATPYVGLGVHAVREALADAGIAWTDIESAYTGTAMTSMAMSRLMYRHLGVTGIPLAHVENASASGNTAFRQACIDVAAGLHDVVLAAGVDKPLRMSRPQVAAGLEDLVGNRLAFSTHFALLANRYLHDADATAEHLGLVAVKNFGNGARNPYAQRQKAYTLDEVMSSTPISGPLTKLQCCPVGEGAAAVILASSAGIARLGLDRARAVRVLSSTSRSETLYGAQNFDAALTGETAAQAYAEAGVGPGDLDVVELHDAFTVEELLYLESMALAPPGEAARCLEAGEFHVGGRVAVSPSGGLLAMGHPTGPTGVGQVCEVVRQLRGEAGDRQQPGARTGLTHMVGVGAVCLIHILGRD